MRNENESPKNDERSLPPPLPPRQVETFPLEREEQDSRDNGVREGGGGGGGGGGKGCETRQ